MLSSLRRATFSMLDRPGGRLPAGLLASLWITFQRRQPCLVHHNGFWVHKYRDGVVVDSAVTTFTPAMYAAATRDYFLYDYTPKAGDTIVDLGAGTGTEAALFSSLVGPTGRVLAIEAHPGTFACLEATCREAGLRNVIPIHAAVSDQPGEVAISDIPAHNQNSIVAASAGGHRVRATTLDELAERHGLGRIDFLKVNIEGAERLALRGMRQTLARIRHATISCHDFLADAGGPAEMRTCAEVSEVLRSSGWQLRRRESDPRDFLRYFLYGTNPAGN
jgi:FkbM family methyltransferase